MDSATAQKKYGLAALPYLESMAFKGYLSILRSMVSYIQKHIFLTAAFFCFVGVLGITVGHHELWGDEIHSWNIAKGSVGILDLLSTIRYEGHPPLWYIILWTLSKFTHTVAYIQVVHFFIAVSISFIVLFYAPFPKLSKVLIVFGYYFIFEYGTLSRNYALAILLVFCICLMQHRRINMQYWLIYYPLLFLLSNVHLLACIMAASVHVCTLYEMYFKGERKKRVLLHCILGVALIFPTLLFIFPKSNSGLNMDFWLKIWEAKQFLIFLQGSLKAFLPMPAWWNYNFWNTHFLLQLHGQYQWVVVISYSLSVFFIAVTIWLVKGNQKSLVLLLANLTLTLLVSMIFPLTSFRYVGFIFIGFLTACWFIFNATGMPRRALLILNVLLMLQIIPAAFATGMDIRYPFSNAARVVDLSHAVPTTSKIVTDYWCLNNLSAYLDKPFFCVDLQKEKYFLSWQNCCQYKTAHPFKVGFDFYFNSRKVDDVYFISINAADKLQQLDSSVFNFYDFRVINRYENAIERWSNVYLYQVKIKK